MRAIRLFALLAVLGSGASAEDSGPSPDPDLGSDIVAATAVDGQLWVLGSPHGEKDIGGSLVSFRLADGERRLRASHVVDLRKVNGNFFVLDVQNSDSRLREWNGTELVPVVPALRLTGRDKMLSLFDAGGHLGLTTKTGDFMLGESGWRTLAIYPSPPPGAFTVDMFGPSSSVHAMPVSGTALYSGFSQGEWGGGFSWLDLPTGQTTELSNNQKIASSSRAIYNSGLDPLNSIIADPFDTNCVVAAVGLIHFELSGRLVRACGGTLSLVFDAVVSRTDNGRESRREEAFFGLVPAKDGYWAISSDAIYRFDAPAFHSDGSATPQRFAFTEFEPWHGLLVNREVPGVLALITGINRRFSVNSGTPLIVPLE